MIFSVRTFLNCHICLGIIVIVGDKYFCCSNCIYLWGLFCIMCWFFLLFSVVWMWGFVIAGIWFKASWISLFVWGFILYVGIKCFSDIDYVLLYFVSSIWIGIYLLFWGCLFLDLLLLELGFIVFLFAFICFNAYCFIQIIN